MKKVTIIVITVLVIAGGVFMLTKGSSSEPAKEAENSSNASTTTSTNPSSITYTNDGFSPTSLTVSSGTTIIIVNDSSISLEFSSDDHPTHKENSELNGTSISPGASGTITVTSKGTFIFHNHLKSSDTGTIVVN